jgi:hypothetical protein
MNYFSATAYIPELYYRDRMPLKGSTSDLVFDRPKHDSYNLTL